MRSKNMKSQQVFAIIRWDQFQHGEQPPEESAFTVKKIVGNERRAREEVDRLNQLNHDKGCCYFYQPTRLELPTTVSP